jgi:hypothetical protein
VTAETPWDLDHFNDDDLDHNTAPAHRSCNQEAGGRKGGRRLGELARLGRTVEANTKAQVGGTFLEAPRPYNQDLSGAHTTEVVAEVVGMVPEDAAEVPWLDGLLPIPGDAAWPRLLTAHSGRATGSYGEAFVEWVAEVGHWPLRWWQRLAALLLLEHDDTGRLVHRSAVLTLMRQGGKTYLVCWLAMWRITFGAEKFGEAQLVVMISKDLPTAKLTQAPMRRFAREHPDVYDVRESGAECKIIHLPSGSEWVLRSEASGGYGHGVGLAIVDEGWSIKPQTVDLALGPTQMERSSPQMLMTSTSNEEATPLMIARRGGALVELDDDDALTMWIEWSLPPDAPLDDVEVWKEVLPHWTPQRLEEIERAHVTALQTRSTDPTLPDPLRSVRTQMGNEWPATFEPAHKQRGEPYIDMSEWAAAEEDLQPLAPLVIAVEDFDGHGCASVCVGEVDGDDRYYIEGKVHARRVDAFEWARALVGWYPSSRLLIGANILGTPEAQDMLPQPAGGKETRIGLSLLRELLAEGLVAHCWSPDLAEQLSTARVTATSNGLTLVSGTRTDLLRATLWALVSLEHEPALTPRIH